MGTESSSWWHIIDASAQLSNVKRWEMLVAKIFKIVVNFNLSPTSILCWKNVIDMFSFYYNRTKCGILRVWGKDFVITLQNRHSYWLKCVKTLYESMEEVLRNHSTWLALSSLAPSFWVSEVCWQRITKINSSRFTVWLKRIFIQAEKR